MAHLEEVSLNNIELPYCSDEDFEEQLKHTGQLNENDLVLSAITHARGIYAGRQRDSGRPFFNEHIFPVTTRVMDYFNLKDTQDLPEHKRAEIVIATILHDTMEPNGKSSDTNYAPHVVDELIQNEFGMNVYKSVYHQSRIQAKGNTDVHGIYLSKLTHAGESSQVIAISGRMNNLQCSIVNCMRLNEDERSTYFRNKLANCDKDTRTNLLPIAEDLDDGSLYKDLVAVLNLSELAIQKLGISPLQLEAA
jgi:(p)ppGpp synthase/HD superfamily hydrolase